MHRVGSLFSPYGIKMFENSDWNEQRTAANGQGTVTNSAFHDEILKDKKGPLSRLTSILDFSRSRPSPPAMLDIGSDKPADRPAAREGVSLPLNLLFV